MFVLKLNFSLMLTCISPGEHNTLVFHQITANNNRLFAIGLKVAKAYNIRNVSQTRAVTNHVSSDWEVSAQRSEYL
jgi:hypothetical protein